MEITERLRVQERSQIGAARRAARRLAAAAGFDESSAERAAIVATELATNLVKHAPGGGELILVSHPIAGPRELDIVALDRGPGTDNVARWLEDGFSTAGSQGTGLGAVRRLADFVDIHSSAEAGTVALARVFPKNAERSGGLRVGGLTVPIDGEETSGDAWSVRRVGGHLALLVADGLGHGPDAAAAARAAVATFKACPTLEPKAMLEAMAGPLHDTRGAAVAIAVIDAAAGELRFGGIGNIGAAVVAEDRQRGLVSQNGTVGHESPTAREMSAPWPAGALLVMHSDGLKSRWSLEGYRGYARRDPSLVAALLYRDFSRGRDDVCVVVAGAGSDR